MILHDLGAIYCLVMNFFRSCPITEMTSVDRVLPINPKLFLIKPKFIAAAKRAVLQVGW